MLCHVLVIDVHPCAYVMETHTHTHIYLYNYYQESSQSKEQFLIKKKWMMSKIDCCLLPMWVG